MKNPFFALLATAALLAGSPAFAASASARFAQGPGDRNFNYGYDKNHRVTPQERARWEAEHRNDKHDDRKDRRDDKRDDKFDRNKNFGFDRDHKVTPDERRKWEAANNYGYDKNHRVTPQERARWEAQYHH